MSPSIYTFRARTLNEALGAIREQLGPDAAVLETRRLASPLAGLFGASTVEVTASAALDVPSRLPKNAITTAGVAAPYAGAELEDFRHQMRLNLRRLGRFEASLVEQLAADDARARSRRTTPRY
jgi:flagellar biosynthesis GTPase FlhF